MPIIVILKFLGFLLFFLYIPAKLLLRSLKLNINDKLTELGLSLVLGIVLITLYTIIIRSLGLNLGFLWAIFIAGFIYLALNFRIGEIKAKLQEFTKNKFNAGNLFLLSVLLAGVVLQNLVLFRGGFKTPDGLIFPSLHDTMWNIALSAELFHHFPPENPAVSGVLLKNNHYFYPLFLASTRFLTGLDIFDLYFRLGPILVSLLFGLGIYSVSSLFTKNIYSKAIIIFLGYFSGNFAYLMPLVLGSNFDWKGNTFFADQPFDQIINPYSVFGFTLMLLGIYCFSRITKHKAKFSGGFALIGGLLLGTLYGFKSFGGITVMLALGLTTLLSLIFTRKLFLLPVALISAVLFLGVFFLTTDISNASLIWAPGWLLTQMMTDKDKLNLPRFADLEMYYRGTANYLGLFKIKFFEFAIYLIGNLGTRIIGLVYILYIFFMRWPPRQKYIIHFLSIIVFVSLAVPLLFNLRNSTFNIIQFTPYGLLLLAIMAGLALEKIYNLLAAKNRKIWAVMMVVAFLALSVPVNVKNILSKLEPPKGLIDNEEIAALNFLRENTRVTDTLLIDPKQFSEDPIYVAAISERRIYLASPGYAVQTGLDPKERISAIDNFFETGKADFLTGNRISYIYLLKKDPSANQLAAVEKSGGKTVFENNKVIIGKTD